MYTPRRAFTPYPLFHHSGIKPSFCYSAQERRYQHFRTTLKRLEDYMHQVEQVRCFSTRFDPIAFALTLSISYSN